MVCNFFFALFTISQSKSLLPALVVGTLYMEQLKCNTLPFLWLPTCGGRCWVQVPVGCRAAMGNRPGMPVPGTAFPPDPKDPPSERAPVMPLWERFLRKYETHFAFVKERGSWGRNSPEDAQAGEGGGRADSPEPVEKTMVRQPMEVHTGAGLLAGLVTPWVTGAACLEGMHPVGGTHAGAVHGDLQPVGVTRWRSRGTEWGTKSCRVHCV